jgi:hypothetical protein
MSTHELKGGCHCGNIMVEVKLARSSSTYNPRACDCAFCRKHGASWVSDPDGSLHIQIREECYVGKYHQGGGLAECILCTNCGVLVGIVYQDKGQLYGTVNSKIPNAEKTVRWKNIWFASVTVDSA